MKVEYAPRAKKLDLENDSGIALLGPVTLGIAGTVSNSQRTEGDVLDIGFGQYSHLESPFTLTTAFTGVQSAYMYAIDLSGLQTAGWQDRGTWIVP
jgi:hypothetical protein